MKSHDDASGWRKRSSRLAVTRPVVHTQDHTPPPPVTLRTGKQLTAPDDHGVRDPAHAVAFTATTTLDDAGLVHRHGSSALLHSSTYHSFTRDTLPFSGTPEAHE